MTALLQLLLDASLRIAAAGLLVAAALYCARVRSAALRHQAWFAVLCAMLLMPVLPRLAPRVEAPVAVPAAFPIALPATALDLSPISTATASVSKPAALPPSRPTAPNPISWTALLGIAYLGIVAALLIRLLLGWRFARALVRASHPAWIDGATVFECAGVNSPLTIGLVRPRILFPQNWRQWPEPKRRAVLAHEMAHVHRRDTAVNFLAHLNRCLFWFHPLSWWLQRQLSLAAEEACDDAGVCALASSRAYAQVLMEIAQTARGNRRLVLQGVGVDGSGLLTQRVDRLLRGLPLETASPVRRTMVFSACAAAIFLAAACTQKPAAALKPDPKLAEQIAQSIARNKVFQQISLMSPSDAENLAAAVSQNPEDGAAREKLLTFYQSRGRAVLGDEKATKGFWRVQLWCIEHHPEDSCAMIAPPLFDPASYPQGAKLWDAVLRRPGVTAQVQTNAAIYFMRPDPKRAEEILKSSSIDQKTRTRMLAQIYASAVREPSSNPAYAEEVRRQLDQSNDARLLSAVGFSLSRRQWQVGPESELSRKYLDRAAALDPSSVNQQELALITRNQQRSKDALNMRQAVGQEVDEAQYQKAASLPAADRACYLPELAEHEYWRGAILTDSNHDAAAGRKAWNIARRYAKDTLAIEDQFRNDPDYANRVFDADTVLAVLSYRADNDSKSARKYLHAAAILPTTDDRWFSTSLKLLTLLLRYGNADDRGAAIDFLENQDKRPHQGTIDMAQSAQKLRKGVMPSWYQYEVTRFP